LTDTRSSCTAAEWNCHPVETPEFDIEPRRSWSMMKCRKFQRHSPVQDKRNHYNNKTNNSIIARQAASAAGVEWASCGDTAQLQ